MHKIKRTRKIKGFREKTHSYAVIVVSALLISMNLSLVNAMQLNEEYVTVDLKKIEASAKTVETNNGKFDEVNIVDKAEVGITTEVEVEAVENSTDLIDGEDGFIDESEELVFRRIDTFEDAIEEDRQALIKAAKQKPKEYKVGVPEVVRCTGYVDVGYTKSGEWTREGVIAGREAWLGRTCNLYRINADGSMGELIGSYTFLDTGYGINGSLIKGTSVDVWHPSNESLYGWIANYGDYVYIEFTS